MSYFFLLVLKVLHFCLLFCVLHEKIWKGWLIDLLRHPFSLALSVFSVPPSLSSGSFELFVSAAARTNGEEKKKQKPTNRIQQNIHIHFFLF